MGFYNNTVCPDGFVHCYSIQSRCPDPFAAHQAYCRLFGVMSADKTLAEWFYGNVRKYHLFAGVLLSFLYVQYR